MLGNKACAKQSFKGFKNIKTVLFYELYCKYSSLYTKLDQNHTESEIVVPVKACYINNRPTE
jgi:hypothetical protein